MADYILKCINVFYGLMQWEICHLASKFFEANLNRHNYQTLKTIRQRSGGFIFWNTFEN
jgi:hypothetical protein